jgi:hypothetical protein
VQENSQEDGRKAKKPRQGEEEDSKEGSDEEDRESEESDNESLGREEISMPKEGHKISLLKCEEGKGKGSVWSAFFCEPQYKHWCTLLGAPNDQRLRSVVAWCKRNPGQECSLAKGSTDAGCAMLTSGIDGVAHGPPKRTSSLHQADGYCSSNAFVLGVPSLSEAQRGALMAESKSHMRNEEFAKLVNATTGFHLQKYVQRLDTYEEFNRAILMRGGQYMASPIMTDGTNSHHIFIDIDRQLVHDPAHPSATTGSGIPMDNRGWVKQLGDWETWHVSDVREVISNDALHDMVDCPICNTAFQPAKKVRYCRNNHATHEDGKRHKAAIRALSRTEEFEKDRMAALWRTEEFEKDRRSQPEEYNKESKI